LVVYDLWWIICGPFQSLVQPGIAAAKTVIKAFFLNIALIVVTKSIKIALVQSNCQRQFIMLTNLVGVSRNRALPLIVETCHCRVSFVAVFT
jgi:hypothetical protein